MTEELQSEFNNLSQEEREVFERETAQRDFQGASSDTQYSMYQMGIPYINDVYWCTIVECYHASIVEPAVS